MNSFHPADILLPQNVDMTKWSVVACDQYTSQPQYWDKVKETVGNEPSTLNLIFPEIYLSENPAKRIESINNKMNEYRSIFREYKNSFIYVKRHLCGGKIRRGLIGAVDLEDYSYEKGASSNIRATEGTVKERIPPRVKIRENAPLEFPHIMVLIDDAEKTVIEPLDNICSEQLYNFDLMQNGGSIEGYIVPKEHNEKIITAIDKLSDMFDKKYNVHGKPTLTFAVGDGNHSLATAKTCWENIKKTLPPQACDNHPARYALVELVNLHDSSLEFEPIHRIMFRVNPEHVYSELFKFYPSASEKDNGGKKIVCLFGNTKKEVWIKDDKNNLAAGTLQDFIDAYISQTGGSVDYIHGSDVTESLSKKSDCIGFLLPAMQKSDLFKTVIVNGTLPRKTFSMGEACDKRYYLEGKKIK